jgi:hypothetical protein
LLKAASVINMSLTAEGWAKSELTKHESDDERTGKELHRRARYREHSGAARMSKWKAPGIAIATWRPLA